MASTSAIASKRDIALKSLNATAASISETLEIDRPDEVPGRVHDVPLREACLLEILDLWLKQVAGKLAQRRMWREATERSLARKAAERAAEAKPKENPDGNQ